MASIVSTVASALAQVQAMTAQMSTNMVGGSIWTDMLNTMEDQTAASLGNIVNKFQGAFSGIAVALPTMSMSTTSMLAPVPSAASAEPVTSIIRQGPETITIPITTVVTLDGQVISRQVERRIVERVNFRGKKVA
jgi:glyceraldehyde-3-phosphate dehydrogenase/erythrose-4-phosphate dehydrogenase